MYSIEFCVFHMAQQAEYGARTVKNPLGITAFWPSKCTEGPMLWEHSITRFTWGVIAKNSFNTTAFYFNLTWNATQIWNFHWKRDHWFCGHQRATDQSRAGVNFLKEKKQASFEN